MFALLKATSFILGDVWSRARAEQCRQNDITLAEKRIPLGGSRFVGIDGTGAQDVIDYPPLLLDGVAMDGLTLRARVEVMTEDAGTSVTPRIQDIDANTTLAVGTASTSTTWEEQEITFTLPAAAHRIRLQVTKNNALARVFAIGVLETEAP